MSTLTDSTAADHSIQIPTALAPPVASAPARVPFADPSALGLGGFALTTFVLSIGNANLIPTAGVAAIALALFYGGIAQFAAGIWEFARGNTFGATTFVSFGAFWLSFWWLETAPGIAKGAGAAGVGMFLLAWAIFTAYMLVASLKTNVATIAVFVFLLVALLALSIGAFAGSSGLSQLGGWAGIVSALIAWYASAAVVINSTWNRQVLPFGVVR